MRSLSVFSSLIGIGFHCALSQAVAERNAVVKDKTLAAPPALQFRYAFQIAEDTALEVIDLGETARQQIAAGLFASNSAGAEHGDLPVLRRIEMTRGKILELPKAFDSRIERAREC